MSFDENTKKEVKEKAAYFCCICQKPSVSVEVHHIIPQKDGGKDTTDNAAPLCPTCHADYGDNPKKRKGIKERRDWWYEKVNKMYSEKITNQEQVGKIYSLLEKTRTSVIAEQKQYGEDLKRELKVIMNQAIDNMTPETSDITTSGVIATAFSSITEFVPPPVDDKICINCHKKISSLFASCPYCGFWERKR